MTDDDGFTPELWTYGGTAPGATRARVAVWYDADRKRLLFAPDKGTHPVTGCVYQVRVRRDGKSMQRLGAAVFQGRHDDAAFVAQLEAAAYAADRQIADAQLERRYAREPELGRLIAPIEAAAAGMSYAQRDALIAMITRKVYRASPDRRG